MNWGAWGDGRGWKRGGLRAGSGEVGSVLAGIERSGEEGGGGGAEERAEGGGRGRNGGVVSEAGRRGGVGEREREEEDIVATPISERRVMPSPWLVHSAIIIPTSRSNLPLPVFTFHLIASITPVVPFPYLIHPGLLFIPRRPPQSSSRDSPPCRDSSSCRLSSAPSLTCSISPLTTN